MMYQRLLSLMLCTFFLTTLTHLMAQDVQREIGVRSFGLNSLGGIYKWQREDGAYHRLSAGFASFAISHNEEFDEVDATATVSYGVEKRKSFGADTDFLHGLIWSIGGHYQDREQNFPINYQTGSISAGVGFLVGVQYKASEKFHLGVEFIPGLSLSTIFFSEDPTTYRLAASASLNNVAVFAVYRFTSPGKE